VVRIELRFSDDVAIVVLSGKFLAGSDGPFLRQKVSDLLEAGTGKLVLNFAEVPYIDSTGLGFLAGSQKLAQAAGATIVLASVNPHVRKVLDSVQLAQFFQMADSEAAALEKLKAAGRAPEGPTPAPAKPTRGRKRSASSPGEQSS
jgi:anti-anti-sigma factor